MPPRTTTKKPTTARKTTSKKPTTARKTTSKPKEEKLPKKLTATEYREAIRRSNAMCSQEQAAAALEYREAVRPIATRRKERTRAAVKERNERNRRLKGILEESQEEMSE